MLLIPLEDPENTHLEDRAPSGGIRGVALFLATGRNVSGGMREGCTWDARLPEGRINLRGGARSLSGGTRKLPN